jgi:hypothetical protein
MPASISARVTVNARWADNSNAPDVRRGAIERTAGYMRRRHARGQAFMVDEHRWEIVSAEQRRSTPFGIQALEAGYVWDERTRTTAGGKSIVVPKKDGWFEHVMNASEYAVINYGLGYQTEAQIERHAARIERQKIERAQRDVDPTDRQSGGRRTRGGY